MVKITPSNMLEKKLAQFSEHQRKIIFENTGAIQLTEGCSLGCPDCGVAALVGVRDYIPKNTLDSLFSNNATDFKHLGMLYFASDPFDYNFDDVKYADIHKMVVKKLSKDKSRKNLDVITSAPRGSEKEILELLLINNILPIEEKKYVRPFITNLSLMKSNYNRLEKTFNEMPGYRIEDQITIKTDVLAILSSIAADNNYTESWKQRYLLDDIRSRAKIEDYHVMIHGEMTGDTVYLAKFKGVYIASFNDPVSFADIVEHQKYIYTMMEDNGVYGNCEVQIRDFYSENLPSGRMHTLKLGEKFKDDLSNKSIACFHGVVLTPAGVYNYQVVKPSLQYPTGYKKTEITPDNFEVIPYKKTTNTIIHGEKNDNAILNLGNRRLKGTSYLKDALVTMPVYSNIKALFK